MTRWRRNVSDIGWDNIIFIFFIFMTIAFITYGALWT